MLNLGNTLHFINRVDETNCGDKVCCPLIYYFDFFKKYHIKRHDIRFIDYDSIAPTDVVILGGGGLFDYSEAINRAINKLLDIGAAVIAWSPGLNTHTEYDGAFKTKINFDKFIKINLRDYDNHYGLPYLPDVTCKLAGIKKEYTVKRKYGAACHKDYPIKELEIYDQITNNSDADDILRFVGESEIIFTNSFHIAYWSMLMGKKTVCVNSFSSKFLTYKYKPEYCDTDKDELSECVKRAKSYDIISECIKANDCYFEQVKEIIENKLTPVSGGKSDFAHITTEAVLRERIRETQTLDGDVLVSQLFINDGTGYFEEKKRAAINNVWGDDECFVRFDISGYPNIKELRFDPTEGKFCKLEIISAATESGSVELIPEAAVKSGNFDVFLNTDPQYFISSVCRTFLEIKFRICLLSNFDFEQNIREYVKSQKNNTKKLFNDIKQKNHIIDSQNSKLNEQGTIIESQSSKLNEQVSIIDSQNAKLNEQSTIIDSLNVKLNEQSSIIDSQNEKLNEQSLIIDNQNETNKNLNDAIRHKISEIEVCGNRIETLLEEIHEKSSAIDSVQQQLEHTRNELNSLYNSRSWRITAPLRKIFSFFRRLFKGEKTV